MQIHTKHNTHQRGGETSKGIVLGQWLCRSELVSKSILAPSSYIKACFIENYVHSECETKNKTEDRLISVLTNDYFQVSPTEGQPRIRSVLGHV